MTVIDLTLVKHRYRAFALVWKLCYAFLETAALLWDGLQAGLHLLSDLWSHFIFLCVNSVSQSIIFPLIGYFYPGEYWGKLSYMYLFSNCSEVAFPSNNRREVCELKWIWKVGDGSWLSMVAPISLLISNETSSCLHSNACRINPPICSSSCWSLHCIRPSWGFCINLWILTINWSSVFPWITWMTELISRPRKKLTLLACFLGARNCGKGHFTFINPSWNGRTKDRFLPKTS